MQKMIPLKNLRFGHEADPPINMRKVGRDADVESLAASIDAHGLGQALNVVEQGDFAFVEDGNRRLGALRLLEKRGNLTADTLIKCEVNEKEGVIPGELGLALNIERVPPHEADQYEKFWQLHEGGLTDAQIALRFGIEKSVVRRALALGKVAPVILDAWRKDEIEADTVKAFTLAPSVKEQEAVFKRLKKSGQLWLRPVRDAFGAGSHEVRKNLKFVGRKDYEKAGGRITEDLFGDDVVVSDAALLAKLARDQLISTRDDLLAKGWSWVELSSDLPDAWRWNWPRTGGKDAKAEQKAVSGCVLELEYDGSLRVTYGVQKPAKATKKATEPSSVEKAVLSNSLQRDIDVMAYKATREALEKNPAASPLAGILAEVVAKQIVVGNGNGYMPETVRQALKRIRNEVTPSVMKAALDANFDSERYFKAAPKSFVIRAIKEAVSPEQAKQLDKGTKAAAWKFALANIPKTGWLPPELRTSHYDGPGAKKVEKAKKAPLKKAA